LVQDTAYQSLLKSRRQQLHQQIAQVLEEKFPQTVETQPELVARHYTGAGLTTRAIPYWQRAGERASQRSAYVEAINHLTEGLELLKTLPDTPARVQLELTLQLALSTPMVATKSWASPEVERHYTRARELCRQLGETPQLFPVLVGQWAFYALRAEHSTARELAVQLLSLAQKIHSPTSLVLAHEILGFTLFFLGEFLLARGHMEQCSTLYDPQKDSPLVSGVVNDPKVQCLSFAAWTLCLLGYPDQALKRMNEALTLAQELSHPYSLAYALTVATRLDQFRRERHAVQDRAEMLMTLAREQGFPHWLAEGVILRGWALAEEGQRAEGIVQIRQGLAAWRTTGPKYMQPHFLTLLAEMYGKGEQLEEGLSVVVEALALVNKSGERYYEAELYRLKGELTLAQSRVQSLESRVKEAEEYFWKAIEIARKQQAKSLELRAAMSLARLWQQQALGQRAKSKEVRVGNTEQETRNRLDEAHRMLSEVYNWFTEGFDTKDLEEAQVLLEALA
jgi:predicted ATPase